MTNIEMILNKCTVVLLERLNYDIMRSIITRPYFGARHYRAQDLMRQIKVQWLVTALMRPGTDGTSRMR